MKNTHEETVIVTYTLFDGDPSRSGPCEWPSHEDIEIEADSVEEVIDAVRDVLEIEAVGLGGAGYDVGDRLYALIQLPDGSVEKISHVLTAEDLD